VRRIIIIAATMLLSTIQVPDPSMKRKGDEHRTRYEHCLIRHDRSYLSRSCDALRHKRTFRIAEMAVEPSPQFVADTGRRLL
jgi:hypothetical protein